MLGVPYISTYEIIPDMSLTHTYVQPNLFNYLVALDISRAKMSHQMSIGTFSREKF